MKAPIKSPKHPDGFEIVELEMIDPHLVINYLFDEAGLEIPLSTVQSYWAHHHDVQTPWLEQCEASSEHIPISLYGDGARCRQQAFRPVEKVFGFFFESTALETKIITVFALATL